MKQLFTLLSLTFVTSLTPLFSNAEPKAVTYTIRDFHDYLLDKNEHYPYSDEFIEKYQQNSGGYLDYAQQVGVVVDKTQHSPNQKWHFFQSWLYRSIEDGTLTYEADAKTRIYNGLLCPELLLWIYEAMGVNPNKVREAMHVAEEGKVNNTNVSTIAKNMRAVVSYDDVTASLVK